MKTAQLLLTGRGFNRGQDGNNKARARKGLIGNLTQVGTDEFKFGQRVSHCGKFTNGGRWRIGKIWFNHRNQRTYYWALELLTCSVFHANAFSAVGNR